MCPRVWRDHIHRQSVSKEVSGMGCQPMRSFVSTARASGCVPRERLLRHALSGTPLRSGSENPIRRILREVPRILANKMTADRTTRRLNAGAMSRARLAAATPRECDDGGQTGAQPNPYRLGHGRDGVFDAGGGCED